jgi:hypothetical protein
VVFLYAWHYIESRELAAVLMGYLWSGDLPSFVERAISEIHAIGPAFPEKKNGSHEGWLTLSSYEQKVYNVLRSKSYVPDLRRPLEDLLDHSRMSIASDKRDHVYSCLGLAKRSYAIRPYYKPELSVEDLFTGVMHSLLLNTDNIGLIERASTANGDHSDALPSWVPDWSQPITRDDADYYYLRTADGVHAGGDTEAHFEFLRMARSCRPKVSCWMCWSRRKRGRKKSGAESESMPLTLSVVLGKSRRIRMRMSAQTRLEKATRSGYCMVQCDRSCCEKSMTTIIFSYEAFMRFTSRAWRLTMGSLWSVGWTWRLRQGRYEFADPLAQSNNLSAQHYSSSFNIKDNFPRAIATSTDPLTPQLDHPSSCSSHSPTS